MGLVMIRCPNTGRELSTGMEVDRASFNRTPVFFGRTFCPICRTDHEWFAKNAWVREKLSSPAPENLQLIVND